MKENGALLAKFKQLVEVHEDIGRSLSDPEPIDADDFVAYLTVKNGAALENTRRLLETFERIVK